MGMKTEWNDLILTAKGWYKSSGSIVKDFAIALEQNENRSICIPNKEDAKRVAEILINVAMPSLYKSLNINDNSNEPYCYTFDAFYRGIDRIMRIYDISDYNLAIIYLVKDILAFNITRDMISLNKPVFKKGKRRIGGKYPMSQTYAEMNRIASNHFDEHTIL